MKLFDSHFHIIDPRYPLVSNNGYLPPKFSVENYKDQTSNLNVIGGALVSGSFQAFDQEYLVNALSILGDGYFGVANIPNDIGDAELDRLNKANIAAVRFNLKRGGSETIDNLETLSNKVFERYGWHTELYVDSNDLKEIRQKLHVLKVFTIDHLGLSKNGLKELFYWVEKGVKIKATGFGRIDFDPVPVLKKIYSINPDGLMFGTDLPSTRAKIPFSENDVHIIQDNFSEDAQYKIFFENAYNFYNSRY